MTMPSSSRVSPNGQSSFGNRIKERERERRKKTELRSSTAYKSILLLLSWFHEQKKKHKKDDQGARSLGGSEVVQESPSYPFIVFSPDFYRGLGVPFLSFPFLSFSCLLMV